MSSKLTSRPRHHRSISLSFAAIAIVAISAVLGFAAGASNADSNGAVQAWTFDSAIEAERNRKNDEAIEILEALLREHPRDPQLLNALGTMRWKCQGNWEGALEDISRAIEISPKFYPEFYLNRATLYGANREYDKQKSDLEMYSQLHNELGKVKWPSIDSAGQGDLASFEDQ
ncbi:MAG: tetratricopeptide repeat protein [Candidatus Obscuribacterales bacterium]